MEGDLVSHAYYNEIDPKAAAWLRELIRCGHIALGEVDERSIEDVAPNDLLGFTQCHFFAGIGIWSHALRKAGWSDDRPIWTGSCPCQPFSAAGKGKGVDDERHLWPAFHWLIKQCRPDIVLGEQVAQKAGAAWFDIVSTELEGEGYTSGKVVFPACSVGAPHLRQRQYWMAHTEHVRCAAGSDAESIETGRAAQLEQSGGSCELGHSSSSGLPKRGSRPFHRPEEIERSERSGSPVGLADNQSERCGEAGRTSTGPEKRTSDGGSAIGVADAGNESIERHTGAIPSPKTQVDSERLKDGVEHHGHPDDSEAGNPGPTNGHWGDVDWLFCRDGKWRPVEPGTFPLADGSPQRVGLLRGYGNGIVAGQAKAFIEVIQEIIS